MAFNRPPVVAASAQPFAEPPTLNPPQPPAAAPLHSAPPPMPPFPSVPEKGGFFHGVKFIAEVLWWALTAGWMLFNRLPRWARILVTIWAVLMLFSTRGCKPTVSVGDSEPRPRVKVSADANSALPPEAQEAIKNAADEFAQAARDARKNGKPGDLARLGVEIAKSLATASGAPEGPAAGRRLVLTPFAKLSSEEPADKFCSAVFTSLYGRLTLTHARDVGLLRQPPGAAGDSGLMARGKTLGSTYILTGHLTGEGDARALTVRLLVTEDGSTKWTQTFPVANAEPTEAADKIGEKIDELLPRREMPARPGKP
jgi:hypothetical protein